MLSLFHNTNLLDESNNLAKKISANDFIGNIILYAIGQSKKKNLQTISIKAQ